MKTFETESYYIPEGATHYRNETEHFYFVWIKGVGSDEFMIKVVNGDRWLSRMESDFADSMKPIPQTKEVEWVNGDDVEVYGKPYKYVGLDPFNENLCICLANEHDDPQCFSIEALSKPETEAERVERELEAKKAKEVNDMCFAVTSLRLSQAVALYDAGYSKEGE